MVRQECPTYRERDVNAGAKLTGSAGLPLIVLLANTGLSGEGGRGTRHPSISFLQRTTHRPLTSPFGRDGRLSLH